MFPGIFLLQPQHIIHHSPGLRAPVNIVPHKQEDIPFQVGLDPVQQPLQLIQTAVDVPHRIDAHMVPVTG